MAEAPGADWFREMAELTGDMYAMVRTRPTLQIEFVAGPPAERVGLKSDGTVGDGRPLRDRLDLLERADKALYAAKDRGRNCVVAAD